MAKPNYSFEKRQRDLEKKKKQEEKRLKKLDRKVGGDSPTGDDDGQQPAPAPTAGPEGN